MTSKSKQKSRSSRDVSRDRAARHAIVEDDVIVEEVLPEEEECSQMNLLSGREEVSSAKMQEIYDRKFAPPRPKSDSSLRGSSNRSRTVDLSSARKSATARAQAFTHKGDNVRKGKEGGKEEEEEVDEAEVEKIVKQMKAAKVYDYDAELGIRTIEAQSDDSDDDDSDSDTSADNGENQNQNQNKSEAATMKKKKKTKKMDGSADNEEGDIDPLFGRRGKCPLQLLSEFIDAVTLKDYESALNLCEMILIFEPTNETALEFIPNLKEKIKIEEEQGTDSDDSSSDSDDDDDESESGESDDDDEL